MSEPERRIMERFSFALPARLSVASEGGKCESFELFSRDICARGAFFETDRAVMPGTAVKIDLVIELDALKELEVNRSCVKLWGTIIRTDENGMAVCFQERYQISPLLAE